jgi:plasmid stability protein
MAQLIVRNLDESIVKALKARAAAHGRSMEAEHRAVLEEALRRTPDQRMQENWLRETQRLRDSFPKAGEGESTLDMLRDFRDNR